MADIDLKTETPDTTLPATGFLFGADSQASASPSVYSTQAVATTLLGSTTLSGTTITANAPVVDFAQTWNNAAVTFTGAKLNITDTASNAASLLMDLQVGGTSKASISKTGSAMFGGTALSIGSANNTLVLYNASLFSWSSSGGVSNNAAVGDTILSRRGAANLRLGAADTTGTTAPTPQFLSAQSWASSTTNNQTGANFTIDGSQGTGTGAGGSIIFRVAPAGVTANGVQNGLVAALTIASDSTFTIGGTSPSIIGPGNTGRFTFSGPNASLCYGGVNNSFGIALISPSGGTNTNLVVHSVGTIGFSSTSNANAAMDTILARDDSNKLALRNGGTASVPVPQTFRVYNWLDGANYERGFIRFVSNELQIGGEQSGGTDRGLAIVANAAVNYMRSGGNWVFQSTNGGTGYFALSNGDAANRMIIRNAALSDAPLIQIGGTTSSFPALKRSSTTLQARLADDSAFASVQGKLTTETAYTAGAPTATGYIIIYDSTGTAYRVPALAN